MITPLFPEHGPITIEQGRTGDCYFLSSLDCIFTSGPQGVEKVKSLFTETEQGVTVRIKKTSISSNLKPEKMIGKYEYHYDADTHEDVFIITKKRLKEIDAPSSIGVKTNALAVKILEHLSSYYYVEDWKHGDMMDSILAHNLLNRYSGTSTAFVGTLLDIATQEISATDIHQIIQLKTIDPDYSIYISMAYGDRDSNGKIHARHGLRLDKIVKNPNSPGGYDFLLINPWNNDPSRKETFTLHEVKSRGVRFCLFNVDPAVASLKKIMLDLSPEDGQYVVKTPALQQLLLDLKSSKRSFGLEEVKRTLTLYRCMPTIAPLFYSLRGLEPSHFITSAYAANGSKDAFLTEFLERVKRLDVVNFVLRNENLGKNSTPIAVDLCLKTKNNAIFELLNRVDFLAEINSSRLNKNVFLQNLIDLELSQKDINFVRLDAISKYIRQYNSEKFSRPLTVEFNEGHIVAQRLLNAMNTKAPQLSADKAATKKIVEYGPTQSRSQRNQATLTRLNDLAVAGSAISNAMKAIIAIPTAFDSIRTKKAVISKISERFQQLSGILSDNAVIEAQIALGLNEISHPLLSNAMERHTQLIINKAKTQIEKITIISYMEKIQNLPVAFPTLGTRQDIEKCRSDLIGILKKMQYEPALIKALAVLPFERKKIQAAVEQQNTRIIDEAAVAARDAQLRAQAKVIVERTRFLDHLAVIHEKSRTLGEDADKDPARYQRAATAAKELYQALDDAKKVLINQPGDVNEKVILFEQATTQAIATALITLKEHRGGWQQLLIDLASAIVTVLSGFTTYFVTNRFRLFNAQTDSEKKVLEIEKEVKEITEQFKLIAH